MEKVEQIETKEDHFDEISYDSDKENVDESGQKIHAKADIECVDAEIDKGLEVNTEQGYKGGDYSYIAAKLRTAKQDEQLAKQEQPTMNKVDYWKTYVKDEESAFKYFQLYHPEYPETLQRAMVGRLSAIVRAAAESGDESMIPEKLRFANSELNKKWDFKEELEKQGVKIDYQ